MDEYKQQMNKKLIMKDSSLLCTRITRFCAREHRTCSEARHHDHHDDSLDDFFFRGIDLNWLIGNK